MNKEYMKEGLDLKRFGIYLQKRIWVVIMLTVIGAFLGGLGYQVYRSMSMPIEYESVSKLYIRFNADENGDVYQAYNGYTWNEILDSNPVMGCIMQYLPGYSSSMVREATKADILSDIRLLTVTVKGNDEKFVREVQAAVENGLTLYAASTDEINSITTIRSMSPDRVYWDDRTKQAATVFGCLLGVISLIGYLFGYVLNESICVQSDLEKRFPIKALGIMTRNQKGLQPYNQELKANLLYTLGDNKTFIFVDIDDHADLRALDLERILNWQEGGELGGSQEVGGELVWHVREDSEEDDWFDNDEDKEWKIIPLNSSSITETECKLIRKIGGVTILIPFGVNNASRKMERVLSLMKNQDLNVYGAVIAEADEEYLNRYYA